MSVQRSTENTLRETEATKKATHHLVTVIVPFVLRLWFVFVGVTVHVSRAPTSSPGRFSAPRQGTGASRCSVAEAIAARDRNPMHSK